jgi:hypothetical protein
MEPFDDNVTAVACDPGRAVFLGCSKARCVRKCDQNQWVRATLPIPPAEKDCLLTGIAVDRAGDVWVLDSPNHRVLRYRRGN